MHELSLAMALVEQIREIMVAENAGELVAVTVAIGTLSGVERHAFEFCFPLAMQSTPWSAAQLHIIEVPLQLLCQECGKTSQPEEVFMVRCGVCDSGQVEIIAGRDFVIQSLEVK